MTDRRPQAQKAGPPLTTAAVTALDACETNSLFLCVDKMEVMAFCKCTLSAAVRWDSGSAHRRGFYVVLWNKGALVA